MTQTTTEKTEICTMRICFPVESDDQALTVKKKIGDILNDIPDASVQFTLQSARAAMSMPRNG